MRSSPIIPINAALDRLRRDIPHIRALLKLRNAPAQRAWGKIIEQKLLPRLAPDFPLTTAICGGGSSGKSTLFNALAGEAISPTGGVAGLNRRVLMAVNPALVNNSALMASLYHPFESPPVKLTDKRLLTTPGVSLYTTAETLPKGLALLDTPDFDTGARGEYTNRSIAEKALETSDIFIYIFTNANYNNRDNTDFIARMLTGIGKRKCFLVYRVYPSFSDEDVATHAMTVARNIYGAAAEDYVLGIYRSDEDNAVAAGEQPMQVRPLGDHGLPLDRSLAQLDIRALRLELFASLLSGVLDTAQKVLNQAGGSRDALQLYLDALQAAQSRWVQESLKRFPMDLIAKRFAEIWAATDPAPIHFMRRTGQVLDFPFRMLLKAASWVKGNISAPEPVAARETFMDETQSDLLAAANGMHMSAVSPEITAAFSVRDPVFLRMQKALTNINRGMEREGAPKVSEKYDLKKGLVTLSVPIHPAMASARARLRQRKWESVLNPIITSHGVLYGISDSFDEVLSALVQKFRQKMGFREQIKQAFSAFLNIMPATVAVTYILSTGDPLGAAGIKIKLTGLFGLHDLYALVAIPATTGLKKADELQLKSLMDPLARTWLNHKLEAVQQLFEENITGEIIREAVKILAQTDGLLATIREDIDLCRNMLKQAES